MSKSRNRQNRKRNPDKPKVRNWLAVHAHFRTSAGPMRDKKKQASKKACRGKVVYHE